MRLFDERPQDTRIIKTARTIEEMNEGVEQGFWPLVEKVSPSRKIYNFSCFRQDKETGKVEEFIIRYPQDRSKYKIICVSYYPHYYECPIAAYLIPKDLQVGETVWLEDLIEDIVGSTYHGAYRLAQVAAIWNGSNFEIQFDPKKDVVNYIG